MDEPTIAQRTEHRRKDEIHTCVRPGCGARAKVALHVEAPVRLGGRDFMPGEFVDLCPGHDPELRAVANEAVALGFGGPFDTPWMRGMLLAGDLYVRNPLEQLTEWPPAAGEAA